jgi:hypothetical protein
VHAPPGPPLNSGHRGRDRDVPRRALRPFARRAHFTLNLPDELAGRGARADLARLCALAAAGRLDGQVELEASWREADRAIGALLERRIGGKAVLQVDASGR